MARSKGHQLQFLDGKYPLIRQYLFTQKLWSFPFLFRQQRNVANSRNTNCKFHESTVDYEYVPFYTLLLYVAWSFSVFHNLHILSSGYDNGMNQCWHCATFYERYKFILNKKASVRLFQLLSLHPRVHLLRTSPLEYDNSPVCIWGLYVWTVSSINSLINIMRSILIKGEYHKFAMKNRCNANIE